MRQIALLPHDVRYAMWAHHCTKKRWGQYGGYGPSPADNFKRSKSWKSLHRGGRVEVNAGRIESFEGALARNHGPWDRRGVIVDADDDDADDYDVDLEL